MPIVGPITLDEIVESLRLLGGEAQAKIIKDKVTELRGGMPRQYGSSHSYRETIQKKIEDHCPESKNYRASNKAIFEKTSRGIYRLIESKKAVAYGNVIEELKALENTYIDLDETIRKSIVNSRIGQGEFRANLIKHWGGCSVTGCKLINVLNASHIKPWKESNNRERLDVNNGLLLIPNLDKLFDGGYISFLNDGAILISQLVPKEEYDCLGLKSMYKLRSVNEKQLAYLQYHRECVYIA